MKKAPKGLFLLFLIVDIGFILYWLITGLHLLPANWLYKDYNNPVLVDWNWSFFPIDMLVSFSGLASIRLYRRGSETWLGFAVASFFLTFCSGFLAISFWVIHRDFDLWWWLPNLFLMIYPVPFLKKLLFGR